MYHASTCVLKFASSHHNFLYLKQSLLPKQCAQGENIKLVLTRLLSTIHTGVNGTEFFHLFGIVVNVANHDVK